MKQEYYTIKQAAQLLNLSELTLRDYVYKKRIKSEKIFNSLVIPATEIESQMIARNIKIESGD